MLSTKIKDTILAEYKTGKSINKLKKELQLSPNTIRIFLQENGITTSQAVPDEQIKEIINKYKAGTTVRQLVKDLKMGRNTIRKILKHHNIKIITPDKKYKIKENYLDAIDDLKKAYFLGWMWSDGNVSGRDNCFSFMLQYRDREVLEKFSLLFSNQNMVKSYTNKRFKDGKYSRLTVYSKKIKNRLIELNCVPNKTFIIKYPNFLLDELHCHFIRGIVEGDGYISRKCVAIIGTKELLTGIIDVCLKKLGIDSFKLKYISETNNNTYKLIINNIEPVKKFLDWIYADCQDYYLTRKYNKYLEIVKEYEKFLGPRPNTLKMIKLNNKYTLEVKKLYDAGLGSRKIANVLNITRDRVRNIYMNLGLYNISR